MPPDGNASTLIGSPVQGNTELLVEHSATKEYLANDFIDYGNQFGKELEVSASKYCKKAKAQQLFSEGVGKKVINLAHKDVTDQNIW